MKLFVTAIGTDSGKTVVSSILTEALQGDYWKPVQAGLPRDSDTVQGLISNNKSVIHPEAYLLKHPESPHSAAYKDGVIIKLEKIKLPVTDNHLIVEGAGGVLVPLNEEDVVIDIAAQNDLEVVMVSNIYLGSINHTLLTISELKRRNIQVRGIVFNGENQESERIILAKSGLQCLFKIQKETDINPRIIKKYANEVAAVLLT